jgi:hypothetical protein
MRISIKKSLGLTLAELIISIAIFTQMSILVGESVIGFLRFHTNIKKNSFVNTEIYGIMTNGIGGYIRRSTGIMYPNDPLANRSQHLGTFSSPSNNFDRKCTDRTEDSFDTLTLYQNQAKTEFITFAVEKTDTTSRLVWRKNQGQGYYLNSEDTYINCFFVSVSPDPYYSNNHKNTKDIQPFVQIEISGYPTSFFGEKNSVLFGTRPFSSYRGLFTLRNYSYHKYPSQ